MAETVRDVKISFKEGLVWFDGIFWDASTFRPNIEGELHVSPKSGLIVFSTENLPDGTEISVPKNIIFEKKLYVNIR